MKDSDKLHQTQRKLNSVSPSLCLAKWKNATLHLHNGNTQSCHHVKSHKVKLDPTRPSSLHNTALKQQARMEMLMGKRPKECQYCWKVEDTGNLSDRVHKSSEDIYMAHFDEVITAREGSQINPSFLEISFDHVCQFSCMYCSPSYSTSWEKEINQFGSYPITNRFFETDHNNALPKKDRESYINTFWQWWPELKNDLEFLRVTGGEPLLSKETFKLIDKLIETPTPQLTFGLNTNLGVELSEMKRLTDKVSELQRSVKHFSIFTSIDSIGPQAEYIRHGLESQRFFKNIHHLLSNLEESITFCFTITVNILSLPGLLPLLIKIEDLTKLYPQHHIQIDTPYLKNPRHLSVEILTEDFKPIFQKSIDYITQSPHFRDREKLKFSRIIELINNPQLNSAMVFLLRRDFFAFINEYDKRKNRNFLKAFPSYQNFFRMCSSPKENFQSTFL